MRTKQKIYLNIFIFGIIFLLLSVFVLSPQIKKLRENSTGLSDEKKWLQALKSQVNSSDVFEENYHLYEPSLSKIQKSFVNSQQPIDFVEFLEEQAKNLFLIIKISPWSVTALDDEPWKSNGFQVSVGGEFINCLKFLEKLENSHFLVEITQTNIEKIEENKRNNNFEELGIDNVIFTINLKTFDEN